MFTPGGYILKSVYTGGYILKSVYTRGVYSEEYLHKEVYSEDITNKETTVSEILYTFWGHSCFRLPGSGSGAERPGTDLDCDLIKMLI